MYEDFIHLNVAWFLEGAMTPNFFLLELCMHVKLYTCPTQTDKIFTHSCGKKFVSFISQLNLTAVWQP